MSIESAKAAAMEALLAGPWTPDDGDQRAPAVHLLKRDGVPVVSRNIGKGWRVVMQHSLVDTALTADEIKARRSEGLNEALRWHRREATSAWPSLLQSIPCPFARDEASEYLRGIMQRMQTVRGN
jgi:hypothetical protein